jgi:hypothetical protein
MATYRREARTLHVIIFIQGNATTEYNSVVNWPILCYFRQINFGSD